MKDRVNGGERSREIEFVVERREFPFDREGTNPTLGELGSDAADQTKIGGGDPNLLSDFKLLILTMLIRLLLLLFLCFLHILPRHIQRFGELFQ